MRNAWSSERLAACVNRLPGVRSTYFWDGRLQDDAEILLIIKTTGRRLPDLTQRLKALHPYELPELVALPVVGGNERYLDWVRMGVASKAKETDEGITVDRRLRPASGQKIRPSPAKASSNFWVPRPRGCVQRR